MVIMESNLRLFFANSPMSIWIITTTITTTISNGFTITFTITITISIGFVTIVTITITNPPSCISAIPIATAASPWTF